MFGFTSVRCCVCGLGLLVGCGGSRQVHVEYVQAQPIEDAPAPPAAPVVAVAGGPLVPGDFPARQTLERPTFVPPGPARPSYEVIENANHAASQEPSADQYFNAVQSYAFEAGATYRIYAAPGYVTDIAMRPGEKIHGQPAAGDAARWLLASGASISASGVEQQHIYIKPTRAGLATNLVVQTDQRTYFAELSSYQTTHMVGVSWTYPREDFAEQLAQKNARAQEAKQYTPMSATNLSAINCEYSIKVIAGNPRWKPRAVCDDGNKTVITFPSAMSHREAPVLYLRRGGNTHLANYLPQNGSYIIPRLIDDAELRLGQDDEAEVVRIARRRR